MTAEELASLAPLALAGGGGVAAMLLAPLRREGPARLAAAAGLALGLVALGLRAGDPAAPYTGLLMDDPLARFGAALAFLAGLGVLGLGPPARHAPEAPALVALAAAGGAALAAAQHAATLFLGLEIVTLALVGLVAMPRDGRSVEAAYKLFLMAGASGAAMLLGLAVMFAATGSLELPVLSARGLLPAVAVALLLAALGFKFSLVPFHMWAPDLFAGAPPVAAAVAGALSKVAVGVALVRLAALAPSEPVWSAGLALAGGAAAILGNLMALRQDSVTRMLGYSSIGHSGYMALALASGAGLGPQALLLYVAAYAPAVLAALGAAARFEGEPTITDVEGLVWRRPLAGVALGVALLSMAGLPPTLGFLGKLYVFSALLEAEAWASLAAAAAGSALAFYYYLRFAARCFASGAGRARPALSAPAGAVLAAATALLVLGGVYPEPLLAVVRAVAP